MRLIIHPEASADIREEAEYYEGKQPGLGLAFLQEIDSAIESIVSMPEAFPKRRKNIHMFVLSRFPFSVLYRVHNNERGLEVLVVRHHARHQDYGMHRA
ncbi:type II toxin-antitoxin system RelE/ParE family toxin [Salinisphaera sp.]|uniref:type II toxin-antitoxin system RelE/ParE family toxin n=1 Tax=Salinisphaera sp. TaxID=1914330 RepID=UPI0039C8D1B7